MTFYKILIAFLCAGICSLKCGQAPIQEKCVALKTGKFKYQVKSGKTRLVTRSDNHETQVMQGFTDTLYLGIRWLGDCEYLLTYIDDHENKIPDSLKDRARANPVHVKIIDIKKDYYIYTLQIRGSDKVRQDTMYYIK